MTTVLSERRRRGEVFLFNWHDYRVEKPAEENWYWIERRRKATKDKEIVQMLWFSGSFGLSWYVWDRSGDGYAHAGDENATAWAEITPKNEDYLL